MNAVAAIAALMLMCGIAGAAYLLIAPIVHAWRTRPRGMATYRRWSRKDVLPPPHTDTRDWLGEFRKSVKP